MKSHFTKWLGITTTMIILLSGLNSCLKNRPNETDFSSLQDFVIFQYGGLGNNFSAAAIGAGSTAPDTVKVSTVITLASKNVASSPVIVTLGVDDTKRTAYNAANGTNYLPFPTNLYKLLTPTVTIPAGENYATVKLEVYARNADAALSYLLPLTILDASGKNLSGNENTLYYHIIGNILAGPYNVSGTRYNYNGIVSWNNVLPVPAGNVGTTNLATVKNASPDNASTIQIPIGNIGTGFNYIITMTSPTTISVGYTFTNSPYPATAGPYSNVQSTVVSYTPPSPTTKASFHIITHYNNTADASGNDRIFDETFVHQ